MHFTDWMASSRVASDNVRHPARFIVHGRVQVHKLHNVQFSCNCFSAVTPPRVPRPKTSWGFVWGGLCDPYTSNPVEIELQTPENRSKTSKIRNSSSSMFLFLEATETAKFKIRISRSLSSTEAGFLLKGSKKWQKLDLIIFQTLPCHHQSIQHELMVWKNLS